MCKLLCTILIALLLISNNAFAIVQVLPAEQVFYYHTDPAGTPLAMTDSSGNVVWRADYKPFGEEQSVTSTVSNDKRFIGKEKDEETGFSYFGARYENAKIGRFIAPDPERAVDPKTSKTNEDMLLNPQRLNTYAYSLNNPYRYMDIHGDNPVIVGAIVGAILTNLFLPSTANAPPRYNSPTVPEQTDLQFAFGAALLETGGKATEALAGKLIGKMLTREIISNLTIRSDIALIGGRSGQLVKTLEGPANSVLKGGQGRIFITNNAGKVIWDITKDRTKSVIPGQGFGPKVAPTQEQLNLLKQVWRN